MQCALVLFVYDLLITKQGKGQPSLFLGLLEIVIIAWMIMKCGSDFHISFWIKCNHFRDPINMWT